MDCAEKFCILYCTRKKVAAKPPLFSRPCGQLVGFRPTLLFYSLRHGRLGLIFLSFHSFIHQGLPFGHHCPFLGHQCLSLCPSRFHISIYILLKWSVTNEGLTDRTESRTMWVISIDVICFIIIVFILFWLLTWFNWLYLFNSTSMKNYSWYIQPQKICGCCYEEHKFRCSDTL